MYGLPPPFRPQKRWDFQFKVDFSARAKATSARDVTKKWARPAPTKAKTFLVGKIGKLIPELLTVDQLGPPTLQRLNVVLQLYFLGSNTSSIWAGCPCRRATSPRHMVHQSKCPICRCDFHFLHSSRSFFLEAAATSIPMARRPNLIHGFDACDCVNRGISSKSPKGWAIGVPK